MMTGKRRTLRPHYWVLREILHHNLDGFLQLGIVALANKLGIHLDFYVGRHADVFDVVFAFGVPDV